MKKFLIKASKIKVVLTDVDGVLTDSGMYYSNKGDIMKKFHTRDGMGVTLLRKNNIPSIIVTKEKNEIIKQWSKKMKIDKLLMGVLKKEVVLEKICKNYGVKSSEICYIGDDVTWDDRPGTFISNEKFKNILPQLNFKKGESLNSTLFPKIWTS